MNLLVDAYEDNFDKALLITGDSDLVPPIEAVKRTGKKVVVCAPPFRFTNELKKMSSGFMNLRQAHLAGNQLPDPVVKADGTLIHKPTRWH